jgi:MFS family permease
LAEVHRPPIFYGYVIVVASFFIQVATWGTNNSFGVFFDPLLTEFGWLRASLSVAASFNYLGYGCASILMGNLNDRFGPRLIMTGCGFFVGLGYLMMTQLHEVWHLYIAFGLFVGVGMGGMDVILLSTTARWFEKKRGIMSGIIKVGTGAGMVVMPILISWLLRGYGWRISFGVLAVMIPVVVISLAQFLVRDPAGKGQLPDNEKVETPCRANGEEEGLSFHEAVRTRQFWTLCVVFFFVLFCIYVILIHIVQHAIDLGITAQGAAGILAAIGGVSIAGRLVMGGASDRIGNKRALFICLLLLLTGLGWLQLAGGLWSFYLFAAIYGFGHGGFFALSSPLAAGLFGTRSHGLIFGLIIFSSSIGGALGPLFAGHLFDVTGSYRVVFLTLTALCILALALTASLKPIRR